MKLITLLAIVALVSCSTTVTTNTLPDGTKVEVTAKSTDPVAVKAAMDAAALLMPTIDKIVLQQQNNSTPLPK